MSDAAEPVETELLSAIDPSLIEEAPAFRELLRLLPERRKIDVGNLWGSSQSLVAAGLIANDQGPWLLLTSTKTEAELVIEDLVAFGIDAVHFPARESYASAGSVHADPEAIRRRLQVAQTFSGPPARRPRVIIASLLSMLQPVPSPKDLESGFLHLQVGQRLETEDLLERLIPTGYTRQPLAEMPGEVSLRGDILDVFPFASELPLRIELFDDKVESLRTFDPQTQRSVETESRMVICIASDAGGVEDGKGIAPLTLLSPTTVFVELEPLRIQDEAEGLRIQSSEHARVLIEFRRARHEHRHVSLQSLPADTINFETRSVQALSVGVRQAPAALAEQAAKGDRIEVLCRTAGEQERFEEIVGQDVPGLTVRTGSLATGFRIPELRLVVVNHRELTGILGERAPTKPRTRHRVKALESFFELRIGDLVVHAVHGVGRFTGLRRIERAGGEEEHLQLIFADDVTVFVPGSRIDLVQRYIGSGSAAPELDKIGGQAFRKRKEKVERAIIDLAAELLEVQAKRELRRRDAWEVDDDLVGMLLRTFPFTDTKDQAEADGEIAGDLTSPAPMDRLLCGDVGFGKTEIAIRAAFRVATAGAQVAVLVPTTVLAAQHFEVFRARLADFPVRVGMLSRYVTGKRVTETISRVAAGEIDILIGTHRILSKDVRFHRLGLVIVDEEQRFGVKHKEHFKGLRAEVDVLTLTATPIPRTLHMSLSGLRDISALTEPPEGRQEIETRLMWNEDHARIRESLLRERNRGGQVFFLHNRVQSIARRARELRALVPECTFAVGHGQMTGKQLREIMQTFTSGAVDVLVATTIVENGIDIPSAGTILIDDADRFGLSELHQLRGRVGRGRHKAYCFLLIDRTRPMRDVARARLKALEELTQLGAGFQISMKDLEIRGAGNILGPEQSGHIAAIGYDMYCRLLKQTTERMSMSTAPPEELLAEIPAAVTAEIEAHAVELELGIRAYLPKEWIPAPDTRLELLRRLNEIDSDQDAEDALEMMRDRYGRIPYEAEALVRQFQLRPGLAELGIRRVLFRDDTYLIGYSDRVALERALAGAKVELRPLRAGTAHLVIPPKRRTAADALDWLEELLQLTGRGTKMADDGDD